MKGNWLKPKLRSQSFVLGCFLEIPSPQLVELLGLAGFDFVVIDREHGAINLETTETLIRASLGTDISAMVRVPANDPVSVRQPLDMGAAGIHVPQIESAETAESVIRAAMYHPRGERGLQPFVRSSSYRAYATADYLREANDQITMVLHIESEQGIANLDKILAVNRVDVVFIGPYDLSQALGVPGEVGHERVRGAMKEIVDKARRAGKAVGSFCDDVATALEWRALGVSYLAVSIDAYIFLSAARNIVRSVKS